MTTKHNLHTFTDFVVATTSSPFISNQPFSFFCNLFASPFST